MADMQIINSEIMKTMTIHVYEILLQHYLIHKIVL